MIRPLPDNLPHPFKGKTVADIQPIGPWWRKGWIIKFTDGTWFSTEPTELHPPLKNRPPARTPEA